MNYLLILALAPYLLGLVLRAAALLCIGPSDEWGVARTVVLRDELERRGWDGELPLTRERLRAAQALHQTLAASDSDDGLLDPGMSAAVLAYAMNSGSGHADVAQIRRRVDGWTREGIERYGSALSRLPTVDDVLSLGSWLASRETLRVRWMVMRHYAPPVAGTLVDRVERRASRGQIIGVLVAFAVIAAFRPNETAQGSPGDILSWVGSGGLAALVGGLELAWLRGLADQLAPEASRERGPLDQAVFAVAAAACLGIYLFRGELSWGADWLGGQISQGVAAAEAWMRSVPSLRAAGRTLATIFVAGVLVVAVLRWFLWQRRAAQDRRLQGSERLEAAASAVTGLAFLVFLGLSLSARSVPELGGATRLAGCCFALSICAAGLAVLALRILEGQRQRRHLERRGHQVDTRGEPKCHHPIVLACLVGALCLPLQLQLNPVVPLTQFALIVWAGVVAFRLRRYLIRVQKHFEASLTDASSQPD